MAELAGGSRQAALAAVTQRTGLLTATPIQSESPSLIEFDVMCVCVVGSHDSNTSAAPINQLRWRC